MCGRDNYEERLKGKRRKKEGCCSKAPTSKRSQLDVWTDNDEERLKGKKEVKETNQPKKRATGQIIRHFCFLTMMMIIMIIMIIIIIKRHF